MGQMQVPKAATLYTTAYSNLRGVDFSQDASLVDRKRSPSAVNVISDMGGNPIKRLGWRVLHELDDPINNIWRGEINGTDYVLVHAGSKLYKITDSTSTLIGTVGAAKGTGFFMRKENETQSTTAVSALTVTVTTATFYSKVKTAGTHTFSYDGSNWQYATKNVTLADYGITITGGTPVNGSTIDVVLSISKDMQGYLWFTAGKKYWYYDGSTLGEVKTIAKRAKILISRNPSGGGTSYDEANLLGGKRTVCFLGNNTDTEYKLPDGNLASIDEVRVMNAAGMFEVVTTGFTTNLATGVVTFSAPQEPINTGEDNVEIDYTVTADVAANLEKIEKCTISTIYGYNASNRVFMSGNSDLQAYHWYSGIFDPTFFGDLSYQIVGAGETAIMGYAKISEYLAIIKESNQQDTTVFLCYGELNKDNDIVFRTKQGIAGIGAIAKGAFATLGDENLFLSGRGIYAVTSSILSYDRVTKNRSYFIDAALTSEANLQNAVACEWKGYYFLAINNHVYVLDGRHTSGNRNNSDYSYECYYLENIPAVAWLSYEDRLYFGTADGKICKFNTDVYGVEKYSDGATFELRDGELRYKSGGEAIVAEWSTPNDDDVGVQRYKTLNKKGCLAVLSPYSRSSCKCYFVVDGDPRQFVKSGTFDIFDWLDIDFERFTFNTNESPQEIYFNKKKKKYKRIQIVIRNDAINEGFGIHEIIKTYSVGNFSKQRR